MKAIVEINLNTPQAVSLPGHLESLLEAAGPGALTLEEFGVSMEKAIRDAYRT